MGWGGGGGGKGGGGGDWGKVKRQQSQEMMKSAKHEREADYFWQKQASFGGGKPHQLTGYKLAEKEKELFGSHDGSVGINFEKYDDIAVEVSGQGADAIPPVESFEQLFRDYAIPAFLQASIRK